MIDADIMTRRTDAPQNPSKFYLASWLLCVGRGYNCSIRIGSETRPRFL